MKKIFLMIAIVGLIAVTLAVGVASTPVEAADHLDAPGMTPPGGDGRLDINDVYAFQSPQNPANLVLMMTVSPAAGALSPTTFHPNARYEFLIDADGNAKPDATLAFNFSKPSKSGQQEVKIQFKGKGFDASAKGVTGKDLSFNNGGKVHAGLFDDPFFFDLLAFLGSEGRSFCDGQQTNFFNGLNTLAIVVEIPGGSRGPENTGIWARTVLEDKQIDRMGRPAINTVFIPNNPFEPAGTEPSQKNAFNAGKPEKDQKNFRAEVVDTLEIFYGAGSQDAQNLANILLPDILTINPSSTAGFLNGRKLADDVIDTELALVTNGQITTDCVGNDSNFSNTFPYLAAAN
jgi:hypothetical protein